MTRTDKYTLLITEKPDAAHRIASALDKRGKAKRMQENGVPYYVADRDKMIVVASAIGHLYTVVEENKNRGQYPVFNFKWVPRHLAERGAKQTRAWIENIAKLSEHADTLIDACDYDVEGSLIGYCLLKYACGNREKEARRMKYSTLTKQELERAYMEPLPHLDFALIQAGLARHEVDWLYGINLSRALTHAARNYSGRYTTLSTGRVQGPTLKFIAARDGLIQTFVPTPYWQIKAQIRLNGTFLEAEYEKKTIDSKREANTIVNDCRNKNARIEEIQVRQFQQLPPSPFDLGNLQAEAYRLFGYAPRRTASIAQRLYLDALISYPRTSSQKLPHTIDYTAILRNLNRAIGYRKPTAELLAKTVLRPREGKKEDPAHPAIYPTGNLPERAQDASHRKIWDLVVRRFMAVFGDPSTRQSMRIILNVNGHHFYLKGTRIMEPGWLHYYEPYARLQEILLPLLEKGQTIPVENIILEDRFTCPPSRYNPSSLLRRMESQGIGTKATRADIIQTLYDRKYVVDERMTPTDLGFEVLEVLKEYCPAIVSIAMTRDLEEKLNQIQENRGKKESVVADTIETLKTVTETLKENEMPIGERLNSAIGKSELQERIIGPCPNCITGKLMIVYSRKTRKRFIGCSNYFKGLCKTSFPLPQRGYAKPLNKNCRTCGWPTIQVQANRRRPWTLCFNPKCPQKDERRGKIEMPNMQ